MTGSPDPFEHEDAAYVLGALSRADRTAYEAHLRTCPRCTAAVAELAALWAADGWPARVDATGTALTAEFSAPSAGPPPWHVYRVEARAATALLTVDPGGATRWRF